MKARLCGFGLWTPGFGELATWASGTPDAAASKPDAELLPARLRRRTALLTRMACHVLGRAAAQADADLARARMILSSAWGEFETTIQLLEQLAEPTPQVSPTLFHNSVHNTATGYLSIALDNREASTAIGAGAGSLRVGLIEALIELEVEGGEVLLFVGDEHVPPPFSDPPGDAVGVGLCLRPVDAPVRGGLNRIVSLRQDDYGDAVSALVPVPASLADNPCARVLAIAHALAGTGPALIPLEDAEGGWLLDLGEAANA